MEAMERLHNTVTRAFKINPGINFEVFIHKVNTISHSVIIGQILLGF